MASDLACFRSHTQECGLNDRDLCNFGYRALVSLFRLCTACLKNLMRVTIDKQMKMQFNILTELSIGSRFCRIKCKRMDNHDPFQLLHRSGTKRALI